jgi:5-methylcytosine-specific restriction endonuclease McrA
MHRRTKALALTKVVKDAVWERDGQACVLCGSPYAFPEAHYISRAQGGLGIEENVVTLCRSCHGRYDNSAERAYIRPRLAAYLKSKYPGWDETNLTYRK